QMLFEHAGTTFSEFVLAERLQRAHQMLTDPQRAHQRISEIAFAAGFSDLSYFNRRFRQRFGDTPSGVRPERSKT
ncbi:helix-turn-helix transcriptional regulator, partial [Microbacteriaceae bacterium K1510]|nr:helix-turn-helix transcriptional regulator [Microbacteriaceae bacterium K1510]